VNAIRSLSPKSFLKLVILKMLFFWSLIDWGFIGNGVATYNFASGFVFPFAIFGIFLCYSRNKKALILAFPIFYTMFFSILTFGMPRFRLPIEPYLIILAAYAIYFLYKRFNKILICSLFSFWLMFNIFLYFNSHNLKLCFRLLGFKAGLW